MNTRKLMVVGNWKMNKDLPEGVQLVADLKEALRKEHYLAEVVLAPPFIHLGSMQGLLADSSILWAAQDCSAHAEGAYTGEVSAAMIRSCGCSYVIIGHSERRSYHAEDDQLLAQKVSQALAAGLKVIFCVGEQLADRESGAYFSVVEAQIRNGLSHLSVEQMAQIVVAYEPVWAIGTGLTATPMQAQEMHQHIRQMISEIFGVERSDATTILYGGSCKASNAVELFAQPDVDGGLIGGAALAVDTFVPIVLANQ